MFQLSYETARLRQFSANQSVPSDNRSKLGESLHFRRVILIDYDNIFVTHS